MTVPEVISWAIGILITVALSLLGIGVTIWVVTAQLRKQHESNLAVQQEGLRNQLRLQLFQSITKRLDEAIDLLLKSGFKVGGVVRTYELRSKGVRLDIETTAEELSEVHHTAHEAFTKLIKLLEAHEMVFPEAIPMKNALSEEMNHLLEAHSKFYSKAILHLRLPAHLEAMIPGKPVFPLEPKDEDLKEMEVLANDYQQLCWDFVGYVADLRAACQNVLLGSLFDSRVPERMPPDPNVRVLRPGPTNR